MYKIEAIPEQLGAYYRSDPFESREMAEKFRADFLVDPEGQHFKIVAVRERKSRKTTKTVAKKAKGRRAVSV